MLFPLEIDYLIKGILDKLSRSNARKVSGIKIFILEHINFY